MFWNNKKYISGWGYGSKGSPKIISYDKTSKVFVGKYVFISNEVVLLMGTNRLTNFISAYFTGLNPVSNEERGDITIGNDVFIGCGVTIVGSVIIGDGVIIKEGSVVTNDIPDYAIVSGNPSIVERFRFDKENIEKLLDISWWRWNNDLILSRYDDICSNDIDNFIKKFHNL